MRLSVSSRLFGSLPLMYLYLYRVLVPVLYLNAAATITRMKRTLRSSIIFHPSNCASSMPVRSFSLPRAALRRVVASLSNTVASARYASSSLPWTSGSYECVTGCAVAVAVFFFFCPVSLSESALRVYIPSSSGQEWARSSYPDAGRIYGHPVPVETSMQAG